VNPFDKSGQERPSNVNPFDKSGQGRPSNVTPFGPPKLDAKPTAIIPPDFDSILAKLPELTALPNWLLWKYMPPEKPGKKWRKVPFQPNGRTASTTKPKTWSTFEACRAAYEHGGFDGVGFVFDGKIGPDGCCYTGIDFDDCVSSDGDDVKIDPHQQQRIDLLNTYTEQSPGGRGVHCICRSEPLTMGKHDGVEIYSHDRYFTVTGRSGGKIRNATAALQAIAADARAKTKQDKRANKLVLLDGGKAAPTTDSDESSGQKNYWFGLLRPEHKDEVLDHGLSCITKNSKLLELEDNGGNNTEYHNLVTSIARSDAPHAEDIFVKHASTATNADSPEELREHFERAKKPPTSGQGITVGTFIRVALKHGADFEKWKRLVPDLPILPPHLRPSLKGGIYNQNEVLELLNSHFIIGRRGQEAAGVHRINDDGSLTYLKAEHFKLEIENIFVAGSLGGVSSAYTFWKTHRQRHQRTIVFKPGGKERPNEYNLWREWGVEAREGLKKIQSLLQHIRSVICRNDMTKVRYLMKWLAWKVQNPDKHPETVIVIKGEEQGGGKTLLSNVMRRIFGKHATIITDKEQLFGRFNDFLEPICFLQIEEALWSGDPQLADKMKHFITGDEIPIERKFGPRFTIPNRLASIITTNHQHAVTLGVRDRRNVVYEADRKFIGDEDYFNRLWGDINGGGIEEFLHLLLNAPIGDWHPRQIIKTAESYEEQRMSADPISQWAQTCIDDDKISLNRGPITRTFELGKRITTEHLYESYVSGCRQRGVRPTGRTEFCRVCTQMFGPRQRLIPGEEKEQSSGLEISVYGSSRPWGYDVPMGEDWQEKLDERLGIPKPADTNESEMA